MDSTRPQTKKREVCENGDRWTPPQGLICGSAIVEEATGSALRRDGISPSSFS